MKYNRERTICKNVAMQLRLEFSTENQEGGGHIAECLARVWSLDAIVFTTGSGAAEWLAREMVLEGLEAFGIELDREQNCAIRAEEEAEITVADLLIKVFVIPTNEELVMAEDVAAIHSGRSCDPLYNDYSFANSDFLPSVSMPLG